MKGEPAIRQGRQVAASGCWGGAPERCRIRATATGDRHGIVKGAAGFRGRFIRKNAEEESTCTGISQNGQLFRRKKKSDQCESLPRHDKGGSSDRQWKSTAQQQRLYTEVENEKLGGGWKTSQSGY